MVILMLRTSLKCLNHQLLIHTCVIWLKINNLFFFLLKTTAAFLCLPANNSKLTELLKTKKEQMIRFGLQDNYEKIAEKYEDICHDNDSNVSRL